MPTPSLPNIGDDPSPRQIYDHLIRLQRELEWLLANLDTLNVRRLNAEVVEAGTITGDKIAADTITADKIDVSELSAITANLGTITAGLIVGINIIGSYIATAAGTYPRAEMSNTENAFAVHLNANQRLTIEPGVGGTGNPSIVFTEYNGGLKGRIQMYTSFENSLLIASDGDVRFSVGSGYGVRFPSWSAVKSISPGQTLQAALDAKANAFSGYSGSVVAGTRTLNFSNGILTSVT
ncbi:hypothetical protein [Cohnella yongneupensis]|uniref:DUF1983 domain-containing protein n=1 Tax=Cohnella yongneupensis TaxID=425006 RepID=A0ABW0R8U1_9BACL